MDAIRSETAVSLAYFALFFTIVSALNPLKLLLTFLYHAFECCIIYGLVVLIKPELEQFVARMEPKAAELLTVLKNHNLSIDTKVTHLLGLKSDIKQKNVPEGAVPSIFECLQLSIGSQHFSLLAAGFSTLGHFLKRLLIQEQHHLVSLQARNLYPLLLERLGDHKERVRAQAAQAFTDLWPAASAEVEHYVLEVALVGKNPKAKEMSMIWLSNMTKTHGLLFRSYVPDLVACLEDADSAVRDTAKLTVVELFQNAPPRAKSDLKRQLAANNVRKSIANAILASIGLETSDDLSMSRMETLHHQPASRAGSHPPRPPSRGDALHQRPASRIDGHHSHPSSRGDGLHHRPISVAENPLPRPPSRGEALHRRPISVVEKQPPRPPSRGDALHHRPDSDETPTPRAPSRGDTLHQRPAPVVSAPARQPVEASKEAPPVTRQSETTKSRPGSSKSDQAKPAGATRATTNIRSDAPTPRPSSQEGDRVEPLTIASPRELENIVRDMLPFFEGKESEQNWMHREKSLATLRRITHGNAPHDFSQIYIASVKSLLDGIFKVALSLRTTLSTTGCLLVQDIARICGPRIDPMVEIIMQNLIKLCAGTKKITAQNGNATVDAVLENVTYTPRILYHVSSAAQEKNVQLRLSAAGWLKTLIIKQARHKSSIEHQGGLDIIAKCIKKNLSDANPGVREAIRSTFWAFYGVWPERAREILSDLDTKSRTLLEKDPSNPSLGPSALQTSTASKKGLTGSTSFRSGLKEAIAAGKRAYHAPTKAIPPRPASAQSILPDAPTDCAQKPPVAKTVSTSSLSSAPMRPPVKPRLPDVTRPATAVDPHPKACNIPESPSSIPVSKPCTPLSKPASCTRLRQRNQLQATSPTKNKPKRIDISKQRHMDPPVATGYYHQRSDSHDSTASQLSSSSQLSVNLSALNRAGSENSIRLESPSDVIVPPADNSIDHHPMTRTSNSPMAGESTVSRDESMKEPSHVPTSELAEPVDVSIIVSGNVNKQPEPVHIYEDPVAPARDQQDHHFPSIPGAFVDCETPRKPISANAENVSTSRTKKMTEQDHSTAEPVAEQEHTNNLIPTNTATSSQFANPEPQIGTGSPLPMANSHMDMEDPFAPFGTLTLPKSRSKNNENRAPASRKISVSIARRVSHTHKALEELPTNEPAHRDNTPVLHVERPRQSSSRWKRIETTPKRSISPRSQDPVQAREMLVKGIQRIRTKNMDIHGYRKLQGLIEYHDAIFTDEEQFDYMLMALLDELQSPPDDNGQSPGRPLDLKTQVLVTVRYMFVHTKKYFAAYYARAIVALLHAQKYYDPVSHIMTGLAETTHEILAEAEPYDIIDAVVDMLSTEERSEQGDIAFIKGMSVMAQILSRLNRDQIRLDDLTMERIGTLIARRMPNSTLDVRRGGIEASVQLRSMTTSDDHFWRVLGRPGDSVRNLISYYNARHSRH